MASWICAERSTAQVAVIQVDGNLRMMVKKAEWEFPKLKAVPQDIPTFTVSDRGELTSTCAGVLQWTDV